MEPITLSDGTTVTPHPPGYWWAELALAAKPVVALAEEADARLLRIELERQERLAQEARR